MTRQAMKIKLEPTAVDTRTPRGKDSLKKGPHFGPQFGGGVCAAVQSDAQRRPSVEKALVLRGVRKRYEKE